MKMKKRNCSGLLILAVVLVMTVTGTSATAFAATSRVSAQAAPVSGGVCIRDGVCIYDGDCPYSEDCPGLAHSVGTGQMHHRAAQPDTVSGETQPAQQTGLRHGAGHGVGHGRHGS